MSEKTTVTIQRLDESDSAALYAHYQGQSQPQGCYIELDCEDGTMRADVDCEIGRGVPADVWHCRTMRFPLPTGTLPREANRLMEEIREDAQTVIDNYESVWDGHNHVGRLDAGVWDARTGEQPVDLPGDTAHEAILRYLDDAAAAGTIDCMHVEDCGEWYSYSPDVRDEHMGALRGGMTDEELESQIESDTEAEYEPVILESIGSYIESLHERIADEDGVNS